MTHRGQSLSLRIHVESSVKKRKDPVDQAEATNRPYAKNTIPLRLRSLQLLQIPATFSLAAKLCFPLELSFEYSKVAIPYLK